MNTETQEQSAFPVNCLDKGLTKREYYAGLAMQGLLANPKFYEIAHKNVNPLEICDFYSEVAVEQADSLIAALNK
jgi:hypothetical protein